MLEKLLNTNDPFYSPYTLIVIVAFLVILFFSLSWTDVFMKDEKKVYKKVVHAYIILGIIAFGLLGVFGAKQLYFKTFFEQFEDKWRKLSQLQEPIHQKWKENSEVLFGWSYMMDDFEKHLKRPGAKGPDYPRERMLTLTNRYLLEEVFG